MASQEQYQPKIGGGPYLQVACLCENVVQRADGVLTLVNIIDRINVTAQGPQAPATMPPMPWNAYLVMILKAGRARIRYDLRVTPELPDGSTEMPFIISLNFEGEDDRGIQVVQQMNRNVTREGLHWFNVYLADQLLTRLPLRVVYSRITGGRSAPGP